MSLTAKEVQIVKRHVQHVRLLKGGVGGGLKWGLKRGRIQRL